ncbi:hypothetical protein D3C77_304950 [compost metagenome]
MVPVQLGILAGAVQLAELQRLFVDAVEPVIERYRTAKVLAQALFRIGPARHCMAWHARIPVAGTTIGQQRDE